MGTWFWVFAAVLAAYLIECAIWPEATHRLCSGTGRLRSPLTRSWRTCTCGGGGKTIRVGARLMRSLR